MKIRCITDSSCDLGLEFYNKNKDILKVLSIPVLFDDKDYLDDFGLTFPKENFYQGLKEGKTSTTSQISSMTFYDTFLHDYENGYSSLYVGIGTEFSGTIENAQLAIEQLKEEGKDVKVRIVDSHAITIIQAISVLEALRCIRAGMGLEETALEVEKINKKIHHIMAVGSLDYLIKGGRVRGIKAFLGTVLNVKPILKLSDKNVICLADNIRGSKKLLKYFMKDLEEKYVETPLPVIISYADKDTEALKLKAMIKEKYPDADILITRLSATVITHAGPDLLGIAYLGDKERDNPIEKNK